MILKRERRTYLAVLGATAGIASLILVGTWLAVRAVPRPYRLEISATPPYDPSMSSAEQLADFFFGPPSGGLEPFDLRSELPEPVLCLGEVQSLSVRYPSLYEGRLFTATVGDGGEYSALNEWTAAYRTALSNAGWRILPLPEGDSLNRLLQQTGPSAPLEETFTVPAARFLFTRDNGDVLVYDFIEISTDSVTAWAPDVLEITYVEAPLALCASSMGVLPPLPGSESVDHRECVDSYHFLESFISGHWSEPWLPKGVVIVDEAAKLPPEQQEQLEQILQNLKE